MPAFSRLVRFLAKDGKTYYGDAIMPSGVTDIAKITQARIINGDVFGKHSVTDQVAEVRTLLSPLPSFSIRTVRCLGLNYANHAKESKMDLPKYPVLFYKPSTSLSGPTSKIPIPLMAQDPPTVDYEVELVAVISKPTLNVSVSEAAAHVLGYAVGNDVSHREWQLKRGGTQWSHGKGFDGWAPWGPGIVTAEALSKEGKDAKKLKLGTKVNGKEVQKGETSDLVFGVLETVSLLSRGVTLMPGDVIFTGTPEGVGMGRTPQLWLKHGDVVEVWMEGVGSCTNKVEFEKEAAKL